MNEQVRLLPGLDPDALVAEAKERQCPIRTYCMFSGGDDSTVVAYKFRDDYDALYFIDTGTGVDEGPEFSTRVHVERVAEDLGKPLAVVEAGDAYERMVLGGTRYKRGEKAGQVEPGHGFPGVGMHGMAYTRLKERCTERLVKQTKLGHGRNAAVLFLSGVYRDESKQRAKRPAFSAKGSAKYVSPVIDWSRNDMRRYRERNGLPQSDVAALLHQSGDCTCGTTAKHVDERPMLEGFCPRTFARIRQLEVRAERAGLRWCRWGGYDLEGRRTTEVSKEKPGIACSGCPVRDQLELVA